MPVTRDRLMTVRLAGKLYRRGVFLLTRAGLACRWSARRDILLCCSDPLMVRYLARFWELFQDDPRLRFHVVFLPPSSFERPASDWETMRRGLPMTEVSVDWAYARAWDLVVCADHCFGNARRRSKSLFIGHGTHNKSSDGGVTTYTYGPAAFAGRGRPAYRRVFEDREADRDRAVQVNPVWKDIIAVVGSLEKDDLLAQAGRRDEFRRDLGYGPQDTVVFIVSTWGEHCLWRVMGDDLLDEARRLQGQFRFILSAHPHEYRPRPQGQRVWGEYLRSQRDYGFAVREPSQPWIPYVVASDIVLSDFGSLAEYAALLRKPIVLTPVPEELIWKGSITWEIRRFAPILEDASMLGRCLVKARDDYPVGRLLDLARAIHPLAGQASTRIRREVYGLLKIPIWAR